MSDIDDVCGVSPEIFQCCADEKGLLQICLPFCFAGVVNDDVEREGRDDDQGRKEGVEKMWVLFSRFFFPVIFFDSSVDTPYSTSTGDFSASQKRTK